MEALQHTLDTMAKEFNGRMAEFQQSLDSPGSNPNTTAALAADFSCFKKFVGITFVSLQTQITLLLQQQDVFEMRSRRKMLLVHGVGESKQEDTTAVFAKIVTEKLQVADFTSSNVSRCHRLGKSVSDKPRTILVKFPSLGCKEQVWSAKSKLRGSGLTLSEFLTKTRHEAFMLARQHFGVTKTWTRDGTVHIITPDQKRHRVSTLEEVKELIGAASATAPSEEAAASKAAAPSKAATAAKAATASKAATSTATEANDAAVRTKRAKK